MLTEDQFGRAASTTGFCQCSNVYLFLVPLAVLNIGALVFANHQAFVARKISTEFAETDYLSRAMSLIVSISISHHDMT